MIKYLYLENFKIHKKLDIPMSNLTILTGMNGMGKSSVLQSMLLLRQSILSSSTTLILNLKGDLIEPCCSGEINCEASLSKNFIAKIQESDYELSFNYIYPEDPSDTVLKGLKDNSSLKKCKQCSLFNNDFQYIGADRFGPKQRYGTNSYLVRDCLQISEKRGQCELLPHYISFFGDDRIPLEQIAIRSKKTNYDLYDTEKKAELNLKEQIQKWLQYISPGINISVEKTDMDFVLKYKYDIDEDYKTKDFLATQVGYGVTYCLPIIVAILHAKPGSLILIENPEAHIHPKGQAKLMELITAAAANGVQIVIETHSDHIVNGALVAIAQRKLAKKETSIFYFGRHEKEQSSKVTKLNILSSGRIKNPPEGFFDQIDIDMSSIFGF